MENCISMPQYRRAFRWSCGGLGRIGGGLTENMGNDDGNRCGGRPLYYVWVCVLIVFGRNLDRYVYLFNSCG